MNDQELTLWFPVAVKPTRIGIYQTMADSPIWSDQAPYSYWNGRCFNWVSVDFDCAREFRQDNGAGNLVTHWRGLAKEPK